MPGKVRYRATLAKAAWDHVSIDFAKRRDSDGITVSSINGPINCIMNHRFSNSITRNSQSLLPQNFITKSFLNIPMPVSVGLHSPFRPTYRFALGGA